MREWFVKQAIIWLNGVLLVLISFDFVMYLSLAIKASNPLQWCIDRSGITLLDVAGEPTENLAGLTAQTLPLALGVRCSYQGEESYFYNGPMAIVHAAVVVTFLAVVCLLAIQLFSKRRKRDVRL